MCVCVRARVRACVRVCGAVDSSVAGLGMSAKRIEVAIAESSLQDEEVESLVQQLIQKKEDNGGWQGVS